MIFQIIIEWNDPFCMPWFHNAYPRTTLISWAFLPSFSIWREYQDCTSLHKKDLQLLLTDKSSGWKILVILFGMAHILQLDRFTSVTMASAQWPLNTSAISSHCWSSGKDNFCLTFLTCETNTSLIITRLVFSFVQWFSVCVTWNSRGNGYLGWQRLILPW